MSTIKDITALILHYGWPAGLIFIGVITSGVIYHWLRRAEPADLYKIVFNRGRRNLEHIVANKTLPKDIRDLAQAEINYLFSKKLTGFNNPRLQKKLINLAKCYYLRSRHFVGWRNYLSERNGKIIFNISWYKRNWKFFCFINFPIITLALIAMILIFTEAIGIKQLPFIVLGNFSFWYLPWIMMTSPMPPKATNELVAYIDEFNASHIKNDL